MTYDDGFIRTVTEIGARKTVGLTLQHSYEENDKILVAYADVGSRFGFSNNCAFCIETGIAEQSLIGIISGLAHEEYVPFGIAYAPFLILRAADQIRMSIGEMNLPLKLIGGSAGLISGNLGAASMGLDDVALMRSIPNIMIESPSDCLEIAKTLDAAQKIDKPFYIRLTGGTDVFKIHQADYKFEIGKNEEIYSSGLEVVIFATGVIASKALAAAEILNFHSVGVTVVNVHTLKPFDEAGLYMYREAKLFVTVEEHNITGGLGSVIIETCSSLGLSVRVLRLGIQGIYPTPDSYENMLISAGLDDQGIYERISNELRIMEGRL